MACPHCGVPLNAGASPAGLCPACLFATALQDDRLADDGLDDDSGTSLVPGAMLGTFRIVAQLGRGGMASVYEAYDTRLERAVALKVLPPEFLHDRTFARRFEQEARVVAKLEHPAIVSIYASGTDEGIPWMSMRLLGGGNMGTRLKHARPDSSQVVGILTRVAEALDYAHARGVVHRDIKPTNILFDHDERACVGDFGLAQMMDGNAVVTRAGMVIGTPQYMAPEQALGKGVDRRCDVYSLGIVAYEMLLGTVPFSGDSPVAVLLQHVNDPLPAVPSGQLPEPVLRAIQKAAAKDPAERWPTAGAFAAALDASFRAAGSTPAVIPSSTSGSAARPSRFWLRPRTVGAVSLLGAAALALAVSLPMRRSQEPLQESKSEEPSTVQTPAPNIDVGTGAVDPPVSPPPVTTKRSQETRPAPPPTDDNTDPPPPITTVIDVLDKAPESEPAPSPPTRATEERPSPSQEAPPKVTTDVTPIAAPPPADVIEPPKRIRRVEPRYPPVARTAQLEGDVNLKLTIGADGRIGEIVVERSDNRLFNQAAIEAVRQWEYLPGRRNGVPIQSTTTTTVRFDLER